MGTFVYNLLLPIGFLFYLPGLIYKYRNRGGWKSTFGERFALYGSRKEELKACRNAIWIHAVSVGETVVALSLIRRYSARFPERKFVLSTTTTTGQDVARQQAPENTTVIFCPIDFPLMVSSALHLIQPSLLVIFETEIWPNLISTANRRGIPTVLVNARLSDHSAAGYRKFGKCFFAPLFRKFDAILAQSESDAGRFLSVSPAAAVENYGNLKFDQALPELPQENVLAGYFGSAPGQLVIAAASTHPGEEALILKIFAELRKEFPLLKLVVIPRHTERGADIAALITQAGFTFVRRSRLTLPEKPVDVLLVDTTGEMLLMMKDADVVIMGKSFAGHDEGHNLIEPALLAKPIVTGPVLRNFRYLFNLLEREEAMFAVPESELPATLEKLLRSPELREKLGRRAAEVIGQNRGAADRTIDKLEELKK